MGWSVSGKLTPIGPLTPQPRGTPNQNPLSSIVSITLFLILKGIFLFMCICVHVCVSTCHGGGGLVEAREGTESLGSGVPGNC